MVRLNRWVVGLMVCGVSSVGVVVPSAHAFEELVSEDCPGGLIFEVPEVGVIVHTGEFDGTAAEETDMLAAIDDVVEQFNLSGGTSAEIVSVTTSSAPFSFKSWFHDTSSTVHVGFESGLPNPSGREAPGPVVLPDDTDDPCTYDEAHIAFKDLASAAWNFGTPGGAGSTTADWYTAGHLDAAGNEYFRTTFQHELLHAFGLDHSTRQLLVHQLLHEGLGQPRP